MPGIDNDSVIIQLLRRTKKNLCLYQNMRCQNNWSLWSGVILNSCNCLCQFGLATGKFNRIKLCVHVCDAEGCRLKLVWGAESTELSSTTCGSRRRKYMIFLYQPKVSRKNEEVRQMRNCCWPRPFFFQRHPGHRAAVLHPIVQC